MVYREDDDYLLRQDHRGDCCVISSYELYCYVPSLVVSRQSSATKMSYCCIVFSSNDKMDVDSLVIFIFLFEGYKECDRHTNNNNNNNNTAGGGLRHPEGLYDDEDRTTDEGVLFRIKLKL